MLSLHVFTLQRLKHKCGRDNVDTLISMKIYIAGQRLSENKRFKEKAPLKEQMEVKNKR